MPRGVKATFLLGALLLSLPQVGWAAASPAWLAHEFAIGFMHPVLGMDHILAMVAVGIWGVFLGRPAVWVLPVVFPLVMAVGAAVGVLGVPLPGAELGIGASLLVLGCLIASASRLPLWAAIALVAVFAIFHGHAHGVELPQAVDPVAYSLGFVVATGLLHGCGIALGELGRWRWGRVAVRCAGALMAGCGVAFSLGALGWRVAGLTGGSAWTWVACAVALVMLGLWLKTTQARVLLWVVAAWGAAVAAMVLALQLRSL